jgi:muramoyltetrapeptide carboxypeptidase
VRRVPAPFRFPPPLRPGDRIAVIAPSSPFPRDEFFRGLAWLRARYEIVMRSDALARRGYLAGDDARRRAELEAALSDPRVRAVVAARGGYGATRILGELPPMGDPPRWIVGFSDVTAIHAAAQRAGLASVHGPNVTGLARASVSERAAFLRALERPTTSFRWEGLASLRGGRAAGPIVGGNLALLAALAASGELYIPEGAVVALEDVTERPYRIDRMLVSLRPHLARAAAIVCGGFTECAPGPDGVSVEDVLRDAAARHGVPFVSGAPFGHGTPNEAFVLGAEVIVEASQGHAMVRFVAR